MKQKKIIIVTPVYEDVEASSRLFRELTGQFKDEIFITAVDDGSVRQPLPIEALTDAGASGVVLKLKRNVGHQKAIAIGLNYVSEHIGKDQRVVVMDSDGEDLPSTIPTLLEDLTDQVDVVVAHRKSRVESVHFKAFYAIYKLIFKLLTGRKISFGNFMALSPAAVKRLVTMPELPIHIAGAVLASKLRLDICPLARGPRYAGQSKMNFIGLALHGFRALMIFAEDVMVRVGIGCAGIGVLSITGSIVAIILKFVGLSTPGWFSVVLGILILMFIQTGTLALMTLMLTGLVRSGTIVQPSVYDAFIDEVMKAGKGKRR